MSRRTKTRLVLVLLVLFINLPLVHSTNTRWQVERSGTLVTAELVEAEILGGPEDPAHWVRYRLPTSAVAEGTDEELLEQNREVDRRTFEEAESSGVVAVKVRDGQPLTSRAVGQVTAYAGLWFTLVADALLIGFLLVLWRFGRYGRPELLRLEAIDDVLPGLGEPAVEESDDGVIEVVGTLVEATSHDVVLEAGRQRVVVVLDGRVVHAWVGDPARARGRRLV